MTAVKSALYPTFDTNYNFLYPEDNAYQLFANVVANNVVAYENELGIPQTLTLGATSNMKLEAVGELDVYVKEKGDVKFFQTTYTGNERTDKQILNITACNSYTTSIVASTNNFLQLAGSDQYKTTIVSGTTMCNDGIHQFFSTAATEGFEFMQPVLINSFLDVDGQAQIRGNLVTTSNIFGNTLNVWRERSTLEGAAEEDLVTIGYGFNVNAANQLELIKYSRFGPEGNTKEITKKIAVFGHTPMSRNDENDVSYTVFDAVNGIGTHLNGEFTSSAIWSAAGIADIYYSKGFVGVGLDAPTANLDIGGNVAMNHLEIIDSDRNMKNMTSITASQISSPNILTTSDARLKDIGGELDQVQCLANLLNVDVYSYTFKSDETKREHNGFLAQQLESVLPNAIVEQAIIPGDETMYKTVDTSYILANIVGAIKELHALIQTKA